MAWIESHQSLREHPKLIKATALLGVNRFQLIGHLHALWWWALDYAQDGDISDFDDADIALAAGWEEDATAFVYALTNCGPGKKPGFIEADASGRRIHDWDDFAGKLIRDRERRAEHMRRSRAGNASNSNESRDPHVTVTLPSRDPLPTNQHDQPTQPTDSVMTNVITAALDAPRDLVSTLKWYEERLSIPGANVVSVLGAAFKEAFGREPDYGRLGAMLRDYKAPFELIKLFFELATKWNRSDDPHDLVNGSLRARKNGHAKSNGRRGDVVQFGEIKPAAPGTVLEEFKAMRAEARAGNG